jgi:hypothetical protein
MDSEGVYYEMKRFMQERIKRRARQMYLDWRNVSHLIDGETFAWHSRYIFPELFHYKVHRLAILLKEGTTLDLPSHFSVNKKNVPVRVFYNPSALMDWLMENADRRTPGRHKH